MKKLLHFAILFFICWLMACSQHKTREELVLGKWQIDRVEKPGESGRQSDKDNPMFVEFFKGGKFLSIEEGRDSIGRESGTYLFMDEGKFILTKMESSQREDKLRVLELTETTFKIESPEKEIVTLKRVN